MVFDFFPNPVGIELRVALQEAFDLFAAIGSIVFPAGIALDMAAADANAVAIVFVVVAIRAAGPEVAIGHVPELASVIGPAPTALFACGRAAVLHPVAVGAAGNGVEFFQVKLLGFLRTVATELFIHFFGVEVGFAFKKRFHFFEGLGIRQVAFEFVVQHRFSPYRAKRDKRDYP